MLYSRNTLIVKEVYDILFSKEKIEYLIGFEAYGEGLVVHGTYEKERSKSKSDNKVCN